MKTVSWNDGRVVLVEQTRLPDRLALIETDDVERIALAIRRLEVRGTSAAAAAAYALALAATRSPALCADGLMADLDTAQQLLRAARPGAPELVSALDHVMAFARRRIAAGTEGFAEAVLAEAYRVASREAVAGSGPAGGGAGAQE